MSSRQLVYQALGLEFPRLAGRYIYTYIYILYSKSGKYVFVADGRSCTCTQRYMFMDGTLSFPGEAGPRRVPVGQP